MSQYAMENRVLNIYTQFRLSYRSRPKDSRPIDMVNLTVVRGGCPRAWEINWGVEFIVIDFAAIVKNRRQPHYAPVDGRSTPAGKGIALIHAQIGHLVSVSEKPALPVVVPIVEGPSPRGKTGGL